MAAGGQGQRREGGEAAAGARQVAGRVRAHRSHRRGALALLMPKLVFVLFQHRRVSLDAYHLLSSENGTTWSVVRLRLQHRAFSDGTFHPGAEL